MANFSINGLDSLKKEIENIKKQTKRADGGIKIDISNITNNLDSFNMIFKTNFTKETTEKEFVEYFQDQFTKLIQKHLYDTYDYVSDFNQKYQDYAHFE